MRELPSGTVTFLFTDIEGSTKLAQQYPDAMPVLLARHHEILRQAIHTQNGYIFQNEGDSLAVAFHSPMDALNSAIIAQKLLQSEDWTPATIKVRMGIHTGTVQLNNISAPTVYTGYITLATTARIMSAGHGGQILLSSATRELIRDTLPTNTELLDLGEKRLKDLVRLERIYQLNISGLLTTFPPLKTLDSFPNNLPIQLTSFIGRETEIAEVKRELEIHHLVTLTGSGGTGKTRLSLQVATELLEKFEHGIWFVELAPLTDPELIPHTILTVIGIQEQPCREPLDVLKDYLHDKQTLIVLDNCEHLVSACAKIVKTLLDAVPRLKIMASSREALGVSGEASYPVHPLSLPDMKHLPVIEQVARYEAARLFVDRALLVAPHFVVDKSNAPFIAQICYRLDGIPLAIELAAARVKMMSVEQISKRIDDRFRLLTGGARTTLPRQQTLRALIDWSFDHLSEKEQLLFRRLSVFAGGWTLEAVEKVCAGEGIEYYDVLDLLTQLVNKSLVVVVERTQSNEMDYRMLETIQQYASEKLLASGELLRIKNQHLEYFLGLAEQVEAHSRGEEQKVWMDRLENELDNLRSAQGWVLENQNAEASLRFLGALPRFWQLRSYLTEGMDWADKLLMVELKTSIPSPTNAYLTAKARGFSELATFWGACWGRRMSIDINRINGLLQESQAIYKQLGDLRGQANTLGMIATNALYINDPKFALAAAEECLQLSRVTGDKWRMAEVLTNVLGFGAVLQCDYESAKTYLAEALTLRKELNDKDGATYTLILLGMAILYQENYGEAAKYLNEALVLSREMGNVFMTGVALSRLGPAVAGLGQESLASQYLIEGLELSRVINDKSFSVLCLNELGGLHGKWHQWERSAKLLGATSMQLEGVLPIWIGQGVHERYVAASQANMDEVAFHAAWSAGQAMTLDDAIVYALEKQITPSSSQQ